MVQSFVEQPTDGFWNERDWAKDPPIRSPINPPREVVGINPPRMPRIGPPKRPKHRRPFDPGFVQAPPPRQEDIPPPQTFEVPKVPTQPRISYPSSVTGGEIFGVPQVPTTGGGFLAPSGPGQPATSLAPSGPGQPATSTVPSLSPSSGGGGGFGIDGSTLALGGGAAALAAALGAAGQKENGGGGILSPENILSGLSKISDLTKFTGDGSILDKLLPEGFDLTSLPENLLNGITEALGLGGEAAGAAGSIGHAAPSTLSLGPGAGIHGTGQIGVTAPSAGAAPTTASGFFSGAGPIFSAPGVAGMFPGAATSTAALSAVPGLAGAIGGTTISIPSMGGALAGATAAPAAGAGSMMAAFAPAAIALGGIMALKMSSQKDPGTLAAEAEQRFDQISATKSVVQKHGIQKAIDEFGYEQVLEYAPLFAPGAPGYTSSLLRDQRPDHAVLKEISADDPRGREILEFVASNRGDNPLQGNTAELIKQLDISTTPSTRMRKEMDFVQKQRDVPEEYRDYGISSNTGTFKKGFIDALVDSKKLTRTLPDEHGIEYIKPGNYYNEDPLMVGI